MPQPRRIQTATRFGQANGIPSAPTLAPKKAPTFWGRNLLPFLLLLPAALGGTGCQRPNTTAPASYTPPVVITNNQSGNVQPSIPSNIPGQTIGSAVFQQTAKPVQLASNTALTPYSGNISFRSPTELVRTRIHLEPTLGYTGKSVRIGIIDMNLNAKLTTASHPHAGWMEDIIRGNGKGIAPNATVDFYGFHRLKDATGSFFPQITERKLADSYDSFEQYINQVSAAFPNGLCDRLESILKEPASQRPGILNVSLNESRMILAEHLLLDLETSDGINFQYPNIRLALYGADSAKLTSEQKIGAILGHIEYFHSKDQAAQGPYTKAIKRYQDVTAKLSQAGIVMVVSAGNDLNKYPTVRPNSPGDRMNVLTLSNDVIVVGASDTMGTPADPTDDRMAPFSNNVRVHLAAPGVDIPLNAPTAKVPSISGNSASAAHVTATIALMREANPALKVSDIQRILFSTAQPLADASRGIAGHGILQEAPAVRLAKTEYRQ